MSELAAGLQFAQDPSKPHWTMGQDGLLQLDEWIYIPNHLDL